MQRPSASLSRSRSWSTVSTSWVAGVIGGSGGGDGGDGGDGGSEGGEGDDGGEGGGGGDGGGQHTCDAQNVCREKGHLREARVIGELHLPGGLWLLGEGEPLDGGTRNHKPCQRSAISSHDPCQVWTIRAILLAFHLEIVLSFAALWRLLFAPAASPIQTAFDNQWVSWDIDNAALGSRTVAR